MAVSDWVNAKGRAEIRALLESPVVQDWAETDAALKRAVRMLLLTRPDLLANYFFPDVWARIQTLPRRDQARVILATFKAVVVEENGVPPVTHWAQALFYMNTREPRFMALAEAWSAAHPQDCKYPLRRGPEHRPLTALLPAPGAAGPQGSGGSSSPG